LHTPKSTLKNREPDDSQVWTFFSFVEFFPLSFELILRGGVDILEILLGTIEYAHRGTSDHPSTAIVLNDPADLVIGSLLSTGSGGRI
jgi:hypothetical protein